MKRAPLVGRRPQGGAAAARPGFSLVETLIALTVFAVIFGAAMSMMGKEVNTFSRAGDASAALQSQRFSIEEIERSFRAAGIGLEDGQPMLVYADSSVLAVNGDYVSNTPGDSVNDAIYIDTAVSDAASTALKKSDRGLIPGTSFYYPDTTYGHGTAHAETMMFYFRKDSTTSRTDDYILFRQVNTQPAEVVARDIVHTGSTPFFQYMKVIASDSTAPRLDSVRFARLPLAHTVPMHLVQGDTGRFATIDSVRAVRVTFTATNGTLGARQVKRSVSRLIRLPNAGMQRFQTCGNPPVAPSGFGVTLVPVNGSNVPHLVWTASSDEMGGEKDVVRYVVYRVLGAGNPSAVDAYFNLPTHGGGSYAWDDSRVVAGSTYTYAVAAEDCTPQVGSTTASASIPVN